MAVDTVNRWNLVREVIVQKKSGAIVLQTGRNYLHWIVERGKLVCVSSTLPEASFPMAIQQQNILDPPSLLSAQRMVDENRTLGSILIQQQMLNQQILQKLVWQHWISCTEYLFDPSMHLFWSAHSSEMKPQLVRCDRPLSDILLHANRSAITIPTALRVVQGVKTLKLAARMPDASAFSEEERRIWMHLQAGSGMKQILQDSEVTRITCYKTVFLLWLTGHLCEPPVRTVVKVKQATETAARRIPAEWIIPLCAGALIGALLVPSEAPKEPPQPVQRMEKQAPDATPQSLEDEQQ